MTELEYWTQQIVKGRISRREFMGRAAALDLHSTSTKRGSTSLAGAAALPRIKICVFGATGPRS